MHSTCTYARRVEKGESTQTRDEGSCYLAHRRAQLFCLLSQGSLLLFPVDWFTFWFEPLRRRVKVGLRFSRHHRHPRAHASTPPPPCSVYNQIKAIRLFVLSSRVQPISVLLSFIVFLRTFILPWTRTHRCHYFGICSTIRASRLSLSLSSRTADDSVVNSFLVILRKSENQYGDNFPRSDSRVFHYLLCTRGSVTRV